MKIEITDEMSYLASRAYLRTMCIEDALEAAAPLIRTADAARIAELEAALAPFAAFARALSGAPDPAPALTGDVFRRAAAVMEPKP